MPLTAHIHCGASIIRRMTAVTAQRTCSGFNATWQLSRESHYGQKMEGAKTIGGRCGIAAIGTDPAFLYSGVTLCGRQNRGFERLPCLRLFGHRCHRFRQHRMNHETVVAVPVKLRPIDPALEQVAVTVLVSLAKMRQAFPI
jgi:hypothetical protein